ncbi:MAG: iron-containing redox enzyme family protein [Actinomycetota bacterium]|nr:iron-containing redox enzyme family protein [Actinomycetota bacterium]
MRRGPALPPARGPITAQLFEHLAQEPHDVPPLPGTDEDPLTGDDLHLALYCCYELHYQGFAGVADGWEWEPTLLDARRRLERAFERRLVDEVGLVAAVADVGDVEVAVRAVIEGFDGPSLSRHMLEQGTLAQFREFAVHRSAYQLKEADPHTWAIPRLRGAAKAALVEIQFDEYGGGVEAEMHSTLFATTMDLLGLDTTYGAYLHLLPGTTLATVNLVSMFGLHRRWRGALAGHLAVFETTSVGPMGRYAGALRRLGVGAEAERFYDVHVVVDGHHEVVACTGLAGGLAAAEPETAGDIVFGAAALTLVEGRFARHLLAAWEAGATSLRSPLPAAHAAAGPRCR